MAGRSALIQAVLPGPVTALQKAPPQPSLAEVGEGVGLFAGDCRLSPFLPVSDPAVGGRLQAFADVWGRITGDRWIRSTMEEGYRLEFTAPPPSPAPFRVTPVPADPARAEALDREVADLKKRAIVPFRGRGFPLFSATFFLTPKKDGRWRPILNLRPLNRFIRPQHFRMETLPLILSRLDPGLWACSVDLRDAYLHVPVFPGHSQFLCFQYRGKSYQFSSLPFGLSTAPRTFTRLVRAVAASLRKEGVQIFVYLDLSRPLWGFSSIGTSHALRPPSALRIWALSWISDWGGPFRHRRGWRRFA